MLRPKLILRASIAIALVGVAAGSLPALAAAETHEDHTSFSVTAGSLVFSEAPALPTLSGVTINGEAQTTNSTMTNFKVRDLTGSGSGWHVSVSGHEGVGAEVEVHAVLPRSSVRHGRLRRRRPRTGGELAGAQQHRSELRTVKQCADVRMWERLLPRHRQRNGEQDRQRGREQGHGQLQGQGLERRKPPAQHPRGTLRAARPRGLPGGRPLDAKQRAVVARCKQEQPSSLSQCTSCQDTARPARSPAGSGIRPDAFRTRLRPSNPAPSVRRWPAAALVRRRRCRAHMRASPRSCP